MSAVAVDVNTAKDLISCRDHRYLDVRTEEEYSKGHVHGAVNVPFLFFKLGGKEKNPRFLEQISSIFSKDSLLVVGCASGARSALAAEALLEAGFENVKNMEGGYNAWLESGFAVNKITEISVTTVDVCTAKDLIHSDHRYLDVRTVEEFERGHVHGSDNIPYLFSTPEGRVKNPDFLEQILAIYSKDDFIVVGCASGNRSFHASRDLLNAGFKHVKNMGGGYAAWVENGFLVNIPQPSSLEIAAVPSAA